MSELQLPHPAYTRKQTCRMQREVEEDSLINPRTLQQKGIMSDARKALIYCQSKKLKCNNMKIIKRNILRGHSSLPFPLTDLHL